jgi:hypothetical protein
MDMAVYCRAMVAFCRQHAQFENENSLFWIGEADEWDRLTSEFAFLQAPVGAKKVAISTDALASNDPSAEETSPL